MRNMFVIAFLLALSRKHPPAAPRGDHVKDASGRQPERLMAKVSAGASATS